MIRNLTILLACAAFSAPLAATGQGPAYGERRPAEHGFPRLAGEDPYYECAAYGYQLSRGACAPGWPAPGPGGAMPGGMLGGYDGGRGWGRSPPPVSRGRFGPEPATPAIDPWRPEASYEWVPDYMKWTRPRHSSPPAGGWHDDREAAADGPGGWGGQRPRSHPTDRDHPAMPGASSPRPWQGEDGAAGGAMPWDPWLGRGAAGTAPEPAPAEGAGRRSAPPQPTPEADAAEPGQGGPAG